VNIKINHIANITIIRSRIYNRAKIISIVEFPVKDHLWSFEFDVRKSNFYYTSSSITSITRSISDRFSFSTTESRDWFSTLCITQFRSDFWEILNSDTLDKYPSFLFLLCLVSLLELELMYSLYNYSPSGVNYLFASSLCIYAYSLWFSSSSPTNKWLGYL